MEKKRTIAILVLILLLMCGAGAAAAMYFRADHAAPELTLLSDVTTEFGKSLSMYELIDRVDDESSFQLTVSAPQGTLSEDGKGVTFPGIGSFQVEITAEDEHGNSNTQSTVVEVVDTTPPELKAEEFTIFVDQDLTYQDHVSASDLADGDLTGEVKCSAGKVKLSEPGRYPVTYTVTDHSGNTATLESYVNIIYPPAKKISLSEKEIWLAGNEYEQLKAKVKPADWHGEVEWSSSDENVAEVADGLVVWKSVGECIITARAGEQEAQCAVHCESPKATEVWISEHSVKLKENETVTLTAQVLPSNWSGSIEWSSSDPTVATVDAMGTLTWVGGGTCTITASADEFSDECLVKCENTTVQDLLDDLFAERNTNQTHGQDNQPDHSPDNQPEHPPFFWPGG